MPILREVASRCWKNGDMYYTTCRLRKTSWIYDSRQLYQRSGTVTTKQTDGRSRWTRTTNIRFWRPLLYQLSYTPIKKWGDLWGSNPRMLEPQSSVLTASPKPPCKNRQLPILPARLQTSTFGLWELNDCVRHGNRWILSGIITGYSFEGCALKTIQKKVTF